MINKWIKSDNKLPPELDDVIVYVVDEENHSSYSYVGWYSTDSTTNWLMWDNEKAEETLDIIVSHWMPLPKPPINIE